MASLDEGPQSRDDCLLCVDEVQSAYEQCVVSICTVIKNVKTLSRIHITSVYLPHILFKAEGTTTFDCVVHALGATSQCLQCICDVLDIINGSDGVCVVSDIDTQRYIIQEGIIQQQRF